MTATLLPGRVISRAEHVWSTVVSIDVRDDDAPVATVDAAWEQVREELHRIDRVYSTFRDDSVVSRIRRGELRRVDDTDVVEVLDLCLQARAITRSAFDPWAVPGGFDPSGLVKGWAADRCTSILREHGLRSVSVDAGGDVTCRGTIDGRPWPIGIAHPDDPREVVAVVEVLDAAVATSGTSQRGEHVRDTRPSHGSRAASGARQATVIGPDGAIADALATALVVAGTEGAEWFARLPDWSACLVQGDVLTSWGPAFVRD